jgi:hypothetical protein
MNTVRAQQPAVILRSTYLHLRTLLAIAAIAIVGLTAAVVVLATAGNASSTSSGTVATQTTGHSSMSGVVSRLIGPHR